MPTITITSDGDPYPAKAGRTSLTNDGTTARAGFGGNNQITDQNHNFVFEYRAGTNTSSPQDTALGPMGVANNGVVLFNPSAAPGNLPGGNQTPNAGWTFNAVFNEASYGVDACGGHPESNGEYHYHGMPELLIEFLGDNEGMTLVGWAADGFPVYARYGFSDANDSASQVIALQSSYRLKSQPDTNRPMVLTSFHSVPSVTVSLRMPKACCMPPETPTTTSSPTSPKVTFSKFMPQIGQVPGASDTTCGCIGQTYLILVAVCALLPGSRVF